MKRDELLGMRPRSKKSGAMFSSIGKGKWLLLLILVAACTIALVVTYLSGQMSVGKLQAVKPLTQESEIATPPDAVVERDNVSDLTDAERQYRNQVEDEELVRLLNKQPSKNGGRPIDLSAPLAAAQAKGEQAVKDAREGAANVEQSASFKKVTEGVD